MTVAIWPSGSQVAVGYPGAGTNPIGARTATATTANASLTLPAGWFYIVTGAHNTVTLTYAASTIDTILPVSSAGLIFSDGQNFAILNDGTGGTAAHYYQLAGGGP